MKQQLQGLQELAQNVQSISERSKDFIVGTGEMELDFSYNDNNPFLDTPQGEFSLEPTALNQIADHTEIPRKYFNRMLNTPQANSLLSDNVNHWFKANKTDRMVRTLVDDANSTARAFLSDRYRRIDNHQILEGVLPAFMDMPDVKFHSLALTDNNMYIKAILPRIEAEVKVGDVVNAGVFLRNSEVGLGAVHVGMFIYRRVCSNGMNVLDASSRTNHVGSRISNTEGAYEIYSDETIMADDKALMLKISDHVRNASNELAFNKAVNKMRDLADSPRIADPVGSVRELGKKFAITEGEQKSVMQHLIEGGDLSAYGMLNAVTRTSQDISSYERATEFETIGGKILEMGNSDWKDMALAS